MGSKFLRTIDLEKVCKAMPRFAESEKIPGNLPNIPAPLLNTVMGAVWSFTGHADFDLSDDARKHIAPKKLAAMLDDALILAWEAGHLERMRYKKTPIPQPPKHDRVYKEIMGHVCPDGPSLDALLIYQVDALCGSYQAGNMESVPEESPQIYPSTCAC